MRAVSDGSWMTATWCVGDRPRTVPLGSFLRRSGPCDPSRESLPAGIDGRSPGRPVNPASAPSQARFAGHDRRSAQEGQPPDLGRGRTGPWSSADRRGHGRGFPVGGRNYDRGRFARLFEAVGLNPAYLRADAVQAGLITQQAAQSGVNAFTWTARSGQVWVTVRDGVVQNAGVNPLGTSR